MAKPSTPPPSNALKAVSKTDTELRVSNYIILFGGRDLTGHAPKTSANADGSKGEFFAKSVDVESEFTKLGKLNIDWEHGRAWDDGYDPKSGKTLVGPGPNDILGYVDWSTAKRDEKGIFAERVLDRRNRYVTWIEPLVEAGLVGNSSKAIPESIQKKSNGEITKWALEGDTLTVQPFETRMMTENVVVAMKALGITETAVQPAPDGVPAKPKPIPATNPDVSPQGAPETPAPLQGTGKLAGFEFDGQFFVYDTDEAGEAVGEPLSGPYATPEQAITAASAQQNSEPPPPPPDGPQVPPVKPNDAVTGKGTLTMAEQNDIEKLTALVTTQSEQIASLKAIVEAPRLPTPAGGNSEAAEAREQWPYHEKALGQQLRDIKDVQLGKGGDQARNRLKAVQDEWNKATGLNETVGSEGEFLLQPTFTQDILMPLHEEGPFTSAARRLPVGEGSNGGVIYGVVNETSRATGSRWGGIQGYRLNESGTKTASKPAFREIAWRLKKYAVLMYATDELLMDATQLTAILRTGGSEELNFMANDDILNGLGTGGPTGILNSPALYTQGKDTGQLAATITQSNLVNMWARVLPKNRANGAWYINSEVEPQLDSLYIPVGTGGLEPRYVTYDANGVMKIKGRPVIVNEFSAALGTVGDIVFADMNDYLFWEKGGEQFDSSIHVAFTTDETAFRLVYRCDGKTATNSPITPYKATSGVKQSGFVALATRA